METTVTLINLIFALALIAPSYSPNPTIHPNKISTGGGTENKVNKPNECGTTTLPLPQPSQQMKPPVSRDAAPTLWNLYSYGDYSQQLPQPSSSANYPQHLPPPPAQTPPPPLSQPFTQNKLPKSINATSPLSKLYSSADNPQQLPQPSVQASLPPSLIRNKSPELRNPTESQASFHPFNFPQPLPLPPRQAPIPVTEISSIPPKQKSSADYSQQLPQPSVQTPLLLPLSKPSESRNAAPLLFSLNPSTNQPQHLPPPPAQTTPPPLSQPFTQNKLPKSINATSPLSKLYSSADNPQQLPQPSVQASLPPSLIRNKSPELRKSQAGFHPFNFPQPLPLPPRQAPIPVTEISSIPPKQKLLMRTKRFSYANEFKMEQAIGLPSLLTKLSTPEVDSSTSQDTKPTPGNLEPPIASAGHPPSEAHKPRKSLPQQTFNHAHSPETQMEMPSDFKLRKQEMHHNNVEPPIFPFYLSTSAQGSGMSSGTKLPQWKDGQQPVKQQGHPLPSPPRTELKVINCFRHQKECGRIFHEYIEYMKIFSRRNMENKDMWELITNKKINWKIFLTKLLGVSVEEWRQGLEEMDISTVRGPQQQQQRTTIGSLRSRPFVLRTHYSAMKDYNDFIGLVPGTIYYPDSPTILVLYCRIYSKSNSQIPFTLTASEIQSQSKPQLIYVLKDSTIEQLQHFYSDQKQSF